MKKLLLILFLSGNSFVLFSQSFVSKARWADGPVKADGKANEWSYPLNFYDLKSRLMFGIANDSTNLYLCFENPDIKSQSKLFHCGMKINLSVKKLKRKATLSYPLPQSGDENAGPGQTPDMESLKSNFRLQNVMMVLEGFAIHNGMLPVNDTSGIKAFIDWNSDNMMIYELAIPLKEIFGPIYSTADIANEIILHVEVSAMKKPRNTSTPTQAPMGAAGVVGARAMGGMNYQTNSPGKSPWYQTQEFKQKFVLAEKK